MSSLSWIQFSSLHGGSGLCCASLMTSCVCAACSARITVQSLSTNTNPVCSRTETIPIGCHFKVQSRPPQQKHLIEMKLLYYLYSWCLRRLRGHVIITSSSSCQTLPHHQISFIYLLTFVVCYCFSRFHCCPNLFLLIPLCYLCVYMFVLY